MLIQAANGAVKKKGSYFKAKYNSLTFRLGSSNKAKVAIANRIARVVYHIIRDQKVKYKDLGVLRVEDHQAQISRKIRELEKLGCAVNFENIQQIKVSKKTPVKP